ncbi:MAG: D-2-hydroxyacid dehydrogenase family protein, partial [Polyangiaceae bacterium]
MTRVAVLDDYQQVASALAPWASLPEGSAVEFFHDHEDDEALLAARLGSFDVIVAMRERTPFTRSLLKRLPKLRLLVTTGLRNAAIDVAAAKERGIMVCGSDGAKHPTAELAIGLMIDLARNISFENARMKA